ncbi:MAG: peroxiredoxin-like family protein [Myxococcota bacterium]
MIRKLILILSLPASAAAVSAATPSECARPEAPASAEDTCPLKVGSVIPALTLTAADGKPFDFKAEVAKQPTLFVFYRGGWCPFCNAQLSKLTEIEPELKKLGVQVVAVSPDQTTFLRESTQKHTLSYRLVSDHMGEAIKAFGLAYRVDDATVAKLKSYKMDIEAASGQRHRLLPVPAAYLVGTDGVVRFAYANPDYKVRADPDLLLVAARKLAAPPK